MSVHNGNGPGGGNGGSITQRKIEELLAEHEAAAAALRTTLALLTGRAVVTKRQKGTTMLAAAIDLDTERRATASTYQRATYSGQSSDVVINRRTKTAAILASFDTRTPKGWTDLPPQRTAGHKAQMLALLTRNGYLRVKGAGFVRTAKPFHTKPWGDHAATATASAPAAHKPSTHAKRPAALQKAARQRMATLLAHFDREEARALPEGAPRQGSGLGPLIHSGYLRKRGQGLYVRTAKEYIPGARH